MMFQASIFLSTFLLTGLFEIIQFACLEDNYIPDLSIDEFELVESIKLVGKF